MQNIGQRFLQDQKGMTLIDVAIMLLLIGILTAPMMQAYNIWKINAAFENNRANFNTASDAIDNYYFANDKYPCPANPALGPQNANYGEAAVDPATGDCLIGVDPTGQVATGALPFKNLKMTQDEILDSNGNKIAYAVTMALANPTPAAPFNNANGKIRVLRVPEADGIDACDPSPPVDQGLNFHFLFFSYGPDGRGAFNEAGQQVAQCNPTGGTATDQTQNCNGDVTFVDNYCMKDSGNAGNKFDDQLFGSYQSDNSAPSRIWDTATNPDNLGSQNLYIGIGVAQPQHELEVSGNIRASQNTLNPTSPVPGNAYAGYYCDSTGVNCFTATAIAGDDPNMTCSSTSAMTGVAQSSAKCVNTVSNLNAKTCGSGTYALGFDAGGNIICGTP